MAVCTRLEVLAEALRMAKALGELSELEVELEPLAAGASVALRAERRGSEVLVTGCVASRDVLRLRAWCQVE